MARKVKPAQSAETPPEQRTYFNPRKHRDTAGLGIASVYPDDRGNKNPRYWHAGYVLTGERKTNRVPRSQLVWLDGKPREFLVVELENWAKRVNLTAGQVGQCVPDFFRKHRLKFLKHCGKTASASTIDGYHSNLTNHVFPFFVQKLELKDPNKWAEHFRDWDEYLETRLETNYSRNAVRTAMRVYLQFLFRNKELKVYIQPLRDREKRTTKESVQIPGELPYWSDIAAWLQSLPPGRHRWVIAMCAMFGVRISEALAVTPEFLLGEDDLKDQADRNDIIKVAQAKAKYVAAFLMVTKAQKKKLRDTEIRKHLGAASDLPKAGDYTTCCTSRELGILLEEMVGAEEWAIKPEDDEATTHDSVRRFLKKQKALSGAYPFPAYGFHDFRRLVITLQCFDFSGIEIVSEMHHEDAKTTKRYYQWALAQRKRKAGTKFRAIALNSGDHQV